MPRRNQTALITGASSGIGYELAKLFAADGYDLVLVSRDKARLDKVAAELQNSHRAVSTVVVADLSSPRAPQTIFQGVSGKRVDVLVNNAGFTTFGQFARSRVEDELGLIEVNVSSLVHLTRLFMAPMIERRAGRIWNVSSVAAFMPGPYQSTYYASKAFVQSFSEALHAELKGTGVTVTAICPGVTRTRFHERAGLAPAQTVGNAVIMSAESVARIAYDAGMRGQRKVVTGWINRVLAFAARRLVPTSLSLYVLERMNRNRKISS